MDPSKPLRLIFVYPNVEVVTGKTSDGKYETRINGKPFLDEDRFIGRDADLQHRAAVKLARSVALSRQAAF